MRLQHHLVRHSSGVFHFRLVVPAGLRNALALRVIKRSLRTSDPHTALTAALSPSAGYAQLFARLRGGGMARSKFDVDAWLASDLAHNLRPYAIDTARGIVQTDGTAADHANALEMARTMLQLRQAAPMVLLSAPPPADILAEPPAPNVYPTVRDAITYWQTVDMGAMRLKATAEEKLPFVPTALRKALRLLIAVNNTFGVTIFFILRLRQKMADRPKNCIICDEPAGSREHVFPSALGGRRENKKIYCSNHNHWMGSHVSILQKQLEAINAMLEVQTDRGLVTSHVFQDDKGKRYAIKGADISLAADLDAILDGSTLGEPHQIKMTPEDLPRLKKRAKQRGLKLEIIGKVSPAVEFRVKHYTIPLMQGGDDAMRAVAYLALTFVAHFWPHVARAPGLAALKDMLRSGRVYAGDDSIAALLPASEFVAWSPVLDEPSELLHPTGLGHTIALSVCAGHVLAYVSLLDLQCWTIRLGDATPDTADGTVVVHVDPLETKYGRDWTIHEFDHALIDGSINPGNLRQLSLENERIIQQVSAVMERVFDRRDRLEAESAQQEFDAAHHLPSPARELAINEFIARRGQRLVNHISMFAEHGNAATQMGALVQKCAIEATQHDPASTDGLNDLSRRVLGRVVSRLSNNLAQTPPDFVLSPDRYFMLFGKMAQVLIAAALVEAFHR